VTSGVVFHRGTFKFFPKTVKFIELLETHCLVPLEIEATPRHWSQIYIFSPSPHDYFLTKIKLPVKLVNTAVISNKYAVFSEKSL